MDKCKSCSNAPEYCGVCRPLDNGTRQCCGLDNSCCKGKITRELCASCYDNLTGQIRQFNKREESLIEELKEEQKKRDEQMREATSRTEESLLSVQAMQLQLGEKDKERDSLVQTLEVTKQDLQNSRLQLLKKDNKIDSLGRELDIASESILELRGKLESSNEFITDFERQLEERIQNPLGGDAVQTLCQTLCETVRNEMRSFRPQSDSFPPKREVYQPGPDHRTLERTLFFDSMVPQNTWQNLTESVDIVEVKEEVKEKAEDEDEDEEVVCKEVKGDPVCHQDDSLEVKEEPHEESPEKDQPPASGWRKHFSLSDYKNGLLLVGDTKPHKKELTELHGRWNHKLDGWVFSKKRQGSIETFLESVASKIAEKEASDKRKEERKAKRPSKLKYNEEMRVYVDPNYEILFHPETKAAFAHIDDDDYILPLSKLQITLLDRKGYAVMDKRERKKYLEEYLEKATPLTEKLVEHPKLDDYMILESYPYLFTSDKVAFCKLEAEECQPLSEDDISWLKKNDFETLSKRDRRREIHKVEGYLQELKDSDSSDSDSESDVDLSDSD